MQTTMSAPTASIAQLAGKYLTFQLGKEVYGLEILVVLHGDCTAGYRNH